MSVEVIIESSWKRLAGIARLIEESGTRMGVYSAPGWIQALEASRVDDGQLVAPVVRIDGAPVCFLPLVIGKRRILLSSKRSLSLCGADVAWEADWDIPPNLWGICAQELVRALADVEWDMLTFKHIGAEGFTARALVPKLSTRFIARSSRSERCSFAVRLPKEEDAYTRTLSSKMGSEMRNRGNRLRRAGVELEMLRGPDARRAFDDLLALHLEAAKRRWGRSVLETGGHQTLFRTVLDDEKFGIYRVVLDGRLMGGGVFGDSGDRRWALMAAANMWEYQIMSPQKLITYRLILRSIRDGKRELSLGGGAPEYKLRLGAACNPCDEVTVFRSHFQKRAIESDVALRKAAGAALRWARHKVRNQAVRPLNHAVESAGTSETNARAEGKALK